MRGRNKIFDENEVLLKARAIFWSKGYEAASTDELLEAMGIGKGSFYNAFKGGKKELFEKVIKHFAGEGLVKLNKDILASPEPMTIVFRFFTDIAYASHKQHMLGCFIANTIAELAEIDAGLANMAVEIQKQMEHAFLAAIKTAQSNGQMQSTEPPALLAAYLLTVWNGLSITRRMYPDEAVLLPLIALQLKPLN